MIPLRRFAAIAALGGAVGCGPLFCVQPDVCWGDGTAVEDEPDVDIGDSGTLVEGAAAALLVSGSFALAGDPPVVGGYQASGEAFAATLRVTLASASFLDADDPDGWCTVELVQDAEQLVPAGRVGVGGTTMHGAWLEVDDVGMFGPCPGALTGGRDPVDLVLATRWALLVGPREPDRWRELEVGIEDPVFVGGGGVFAIGPAAEITAAGLALRFAIDGEREMVASADGDFVRIPYAEWTEGPDPGVYLVSDISPLDPGLLAL